MSNGQPEFLVVLVARFTESLTLQKCFCSGRPNPGMNHKFVNAIKDHHQKITTNDE